MKLKEYKPTTSSRRKMTVADYSELSKKKPYKKLTSFKKRSNGRDILGHVSVRHKGAGTKRKYRQISTLDSYIGKRGKIVSIEYDPNRSAFIALVEIENGPKIYILSYEDAKLGDEIIADEKVEVKPGNRMRIKNIPSGTFIYDIEIQPSHGAKLVKTAGSAASLLAKAGKLAQIKMPSGEIRKINVSCFASIGRLSNLGHSAQRIGKAGRNRWLGIRPSVRGKAMHPGAHPHGGGEGVNPIGLKHPKTPWGKNAFGVKTRKKNKYSDSMIIKRRK